MSASATLAFEVGTEEIPAFNLVSATDQLKELVPSALQAARLPYGSCRVFSTPRRMIIIVEELGLMSESLVEEHKGPKSDIAFDEEGNPTKAAIGFARGKGLEVDQLERRVQGGVEYLFATKSLPSNPAQSVLPEILEGIITAISWPKSMRWNTKPEQFSRPVRWLLALLGDEIIPVRFAEIEASNATFGHRFLAPGAHSVGRAEDLLSVLEKAFVVPSQERREQVIREGVACIENQVGARAELPAKTLTEVINLTEFPTPLMGTFDEEFLKVPEEIIVDALLVHQRYFPLYDKSNNLLNKFIAVSNGDPKCSDIIIDGNERVVRPRLSDAKFFFEEDLKHPLDYYVDRLDEVVFQETLGTMKDKEERIVALADMLASDARLSKSDADLVHRAAYLCKADLVTNAVVEFTSVQGVMGSYYAAAAGEEPQVVEAIADHYRPRFAGDEAPRTDIGCIVACADKLDTICGLFSLGQAPTGSSDPFALRRSAIGIIHLLESGLPISLTKGIQFSLETFAPLGFEAGSVKKEVIDFFLTRTKVILRERGHSSDVIDAVLASGVEEPAEVIIRVQALSQAQEEMSDVMDDLATAYARANNLREERLGCDVDESLMGEAEQQLVTAIQETNGAVEESLARDDYKQALTDLAKLRLPIDRFFEEVKVMDDDVNLKNNRLKILNCFVRVFTHIADFGKMAKQGR